MLKSIRDKESAEQGNTREKTLKFQAATAADIYAHMHVEKNLIAIA